MGINGVGKVETMYISLSYCHTYFHKLRSPKKRVQDDVDLTE